MLRAASSFLGGRSRTATPAGIIFNGSNERLSIDQNATSSDRTRFTASLWMKTAATPANLSTLIESYLIPDPDEFAWIYHDGTDDSLSLESDSTSATVGSEFTAASQVSVDNTWKHYVIRWNTNDGSSDNRIRFYKNGTFLSDGGTVPGASGIFHFFNNAHKINVGNSDATFFHAKRMAFIEVLDGVDAAATEFAFDNGGTWTRKPYTGSYGTYGFRIDGTNGLNDASGNGRVFTAANMDASNLDTADLPPYTT